MLEVTVEIINSVVEVAVSIPLISDDALYEQKLEVTKEIINSDLEVIINLI